MTRATVVHRLEIEDGRYPPPSPHCAQEVDWAEIHRQRNLAYGWLGWRQKCVDHGPELPSVLPPLWP